MLSPPTDSDPTEKPADLDADAPEGPDAEPAAPAADRGPADLAAVESTLATIVERLDRDTERAAFRERVIDKLYADVERMRATERGGVLRPVVVDLCKLRNDMLRQAHTLPEAMTKAKTEALLETFAAAVEDALDRCGVMVARAEPGAAFTAGHHQVARTVEGPDPALDGTVAEVVQDGYAEVDGGRVVLPARVGVYRAVRAPESDETPPTNDAIPGTDPSPKETTDE